MKVLIPLPPGWNSLPLVLTFSQVVVLAKFWNVGDRYYVRELRLCGVITSVNEFPTGKRARYASEQVVRAMYPKQDRAE